LPAGLALGGTQQARSYASARCRGSARSP
jgi:hypothetical protein